VVDRAEIALEMRTAKRLAQRCKEFGAVLQHEYWSNKAHRLQDRLDALKSEA